MFRANLTWDFWFSDLMSPTMIVADSCLVRVLNYALEDFLSWDYLFVLSICIWSCLVTTERLGFVWPAEAADLVYYWLADVCWVNYESLLKVSAPYSAELNGLLCVAISVLVYELENELANSGVTIDLRGPLKSLGKFAFILFYI